MADSSAGEAPSVFAPGRRLLTFGLVLTITLVAFESMAIATVMPAVERDLGDIELYGWVFSAFFLGSLIGIVVAGRLVDRMAPVIPFAAALGVFAIGLLVGGFAPSMLVLVVGRALQGIGGGALPAIAYVCIGRAYPMVIRPRVFALLSTAWIVPALVGPKLAEVVADATSWHWVFLGLLPLLAVCGTMALLALRRLAAPVPVASSSAGATRDRAASATSSSTSLTDALVVALGAGLVLWGLDRSSLPVAVGAIGIGGLVSIWGLRRLTPPGTLRAQEGLPAAVLVKGVITFTFFSADAYIPLAFETVRDTSGAIILTAGAVLWTGGSWTQERLINRVGPRRLVGIGFVLLVVGVGSTAVVLFTSVPVAMACLTWGVAGWGIGLGYAPLALTVLSEANVGTEGSATSGMQLCDTLGSALGTGTAGALIAVGARSGWDEGTAIMFVYVLAGSMAVIGAVLARRLPSRLAR